LKKEAQEGRNNNYFGLEFVGSRGFSAGSGFVVLIEVKPSEQLSQRFVAGTSRSTPTQA
jgi:hypothetical protein